MKQQSEKIAKLNDEMRKGMLNYQDRKNKIVMTPGVYKEPFSHAILKAVRDFDDFNEDNDPYKEHDFGSVSINHRKFFWKIDYYDQECKYGSEDPSNPEKTTRVLTVMRADEY